VGAVGAVLPGRVVVMGARVVVMGAAVVVMGTAVVVMGTAVVVIGARVVVMGTAVVVMGARVVVMGAVGAVAAVLPGRVVVVGAVAAVLLLVLVLLLEPHAATTTRNTEPINRQVHRIRGKSLEGTRKSTFMPPPLDKGLALPRDEHRRRPHPPIGE